MKEQNSEEEVIKILADIPNCRRALLENYDNLLNVAEYCNSNYIQVLLLQLTDGVAYDINCPHFVLNEAATRVSC